MYNLALFGEKPAFSEPLHVGRPNIGDRARLHARLDEILDRNWLTNNGPFVRDFENQVAAAAGAKHCVAMCNATIGLEIAIRALGLEGEVIVPSYTFVATAHALDWQGITPIFCDIDPSTHNIDPNAVERLITDRTSGIIGVHLWGRPCAIDRLQEIADRRKLKLIFDAAHGFGCTYKGRQIGGFGAVEVFSFHATKFLNAFEGGAVVTNDDHLANAVRLMKNFGFAGYDNVIYPGTNGKMTEICAAMGITSLESIQDVIACNRRNYHAYSVALCGLPGVQLMRYDENEACNYQYVVIEVDETAFGISRDYLVALLHAENVLARKYFYPGCHRMEPYRTKYPHAGESLTATDIVAKRVVVLPTGSATGTDAIKKICAIIRSASRHAGAILDHFSHRHQDSAAS
jgi:dTDP-4-amino-4,6-dideoxygalactose transaminase